MSPPAGWSQVVRDALAARYMAGSGCFVSNRCCGQLEEVGVPVLPVIEAVLAADVLPSYAVPPEALGRRFPGLLSLLVTYFAVGKDAGDGRVFTFFGRLCGSVRVEAMRAVNIVWLLRFPTGPVPEPVLTAVRELAEVGSGEVQEVAQWLLGRAGG